MMDEDYEDYEDYDPWGMTKEQEEKVKQIENLFSNLKDEKIIKIHFSKSKVSKIKSKSSEQEVAPKPRGIWYDCDGEWTDWLQTEMPEWINKINYIYAIYPKEENIKIIRNQDQIIQFTKEYGKWHNYEDGKNYSFEQIEDALIDLKNRDLVLTDYRHEFNYIDWPKVASSFCGIEICPYISEMRMERFTSWYYGWDIASGCIWSPCGLDIKLLAYFDSGNKIVLSKNNNRSKKYSNFNNWYNRS